MVPLRISSLHAGRMDAFPVTPLLALNVGPPGRRKRKNSGPITTHCVYFHEPYAHLRKSLVSGIPGGYSINPVISRLLLQG